ncbi:hypothetical protein BGZ60DRAFT_378285 [Tricladium varicosporioides]|nr:hypothetical protein BGZ60DRAFT_378285 [Hymenoscyphus varicosporioides]
MDLSPNSPRHSGIPRPSRLPVPRASLRPAASRENLQQPQPSQRFGISNPRLRSTPSRDQLSSSTSTKPRLPSTPRKRESLSALPRDAATNLAAYTPTAQHITRRPSREVLSRKSSQTFFADRQAERQAGQNLKREDIIQDGETLIEEAEEHGSRTLGLPRKTSLSERTMETLQSIPPSPSIKRRTSSFFNADSSMRPPSSGQQSRPGSSSQDISMRPPSSHFAGSRPSSRAGQTQIPPVDFRASTNTYRVPLANSMAQTPNRRPSTGKSLKSTVNEHRSISGTYPGIAISPNSSIAAQQSSSPAKLSLKQPVLKTGSKSVAARPLKSRASINGLFRKPSIPVLDQSRDIDRIGFASKKKSPTFSNTSSEGASTTSMASMATTGTSVSPENQETTPRKSSMALRDQIAKAKAAKRAALSKQSANSGVSEGNEVPVIATGTFDFGLSDDPFNQQAGQGGAKGLLRKRISAARSDGRLNIAAMGFKEIPEDVLNMYNLEAIGTQDGSWAEAVDLTRFVAADNELELISDEVFPDVDPRESADDEDMKGNQFGGLETLDLHGNVLIALPIGLRRLELLTTLNLSNNKLGNDCFEVVSQLTNLRDLKMGGNELSGVLDSRISSLQNLEALDLHQNSLTSLPEGLADLTRLRVFNVTQNTLTSLSFEVLYHLPLIELFAAKNKLSGTLFPSEVEELPNLQILDVTSNALVRLTDSDILRLPSLHQLSCSCNRLTSLPDVSTWVSLLTIAAEDNNISSIPEGFVSLPKIKNVDFNGNGIKILEDQIGGMNSLDIFRISGNPLREKKFAGMTTDDLKRALKARMAPPDQPADKETEEGAFFSAPNSPMSPSRPTSSDWPVKAGGVLDRSNTQSHSLNPVAAATVANNNSIKALELHHNKFKEIPTSIAFFAATLTTLSLSHNELNSDTFMKDDLELPVLKELNLSSNTFNSLQPLIIHLHAPLLEKLDISFNRLTSLPILRTHFPSLTSLFASHNTIRELSPEAVKGLRNVDCSSNDLNSLNARIGLLGGPGGLERLEVSGNRFRVPKYTILEKGTEATLAWLRDRIPAGEITPTDVD